MSMPNSYKQDCSPTTLHPCLQIKRLGVADIREPTCHAGQYDDLVLPRHTGDGRAHPCQAVVIRETEGVIHH